MRFKFLSGDVNWKDYGGKWISKKLNNGDFDYYLVIELINARDAIGDKYPHKYMMILSSVSPSEGKEHLEQAYECMGLNEGNYKKEYLDSDEAKVEALHSYGISAKLWDDEGDNCKKLLKEAHNQAETSSIFFGFMMDKRQNLIGDTGWDFIKGDIGKALRRTEKEE